MPFAMRVMSDLTESELAILVRFSLISLVLLSKERTIDSRRLLKIAINARSRRLNSSFSGTASMPLPEPGAARMTRGEKPFLGEEVEEEDGESRGDREEVDDGKECRKGDEEESTASFNS